MLVERRAPAARIGGKQPLLEQVAQGLEEEERIALGGAVQALREQPSAGGARQRLREHEDLAFVHAFEPDRDAAPAVQVGALPHQRRLRQLGAAVADDPGHRSRVGRGRGVEPRPEVDAGRIAPVPVVEDEDAEVVAHQQAPGLGHGGEQALPCFVGGHRLRRLAELGHELRQLAPHPLGQGDVRRGVAQGAQQADHRGVRQLRILRLASDAQPGAARGGELARQPGLARARGTMQVDALALRPRRLDLLLRRRPRHEWNDARQPRSRAGAGGLAARAGGVVAVEAGGPKRRRLGRARRAVAAAVAQRLRERLQRRRGSDVELVAQPLREPLIGLQRAGAVAERRLEANDMKCGRFLQRIGGPAALPQGERPRQLAAALAGRGVAIQHLRLALGELVAPALQPGIELGAADAVESVEDEARTLRQPLVVEQAPRIDDDAGVERDRAIGRFAKRHAELAKPEQLAPQVAPARRGIGFGPEQRGQPRPRRVAVEREHRQDRQRLARADVNDLAVAQQPRDGQEFKQQPRGRFGHRRAIIEEARAAAQRMPVGKASGPSRLASAR